MSATAAKQPFAAMLPVAQSLRDALAPGCARIMIAGSLRRCRPMVGDIELVLVPKRSDDGGGLFAADDDFDTHLGRLLAAGVIALDTEIKRDGPRLKRIVHREGIIVELYIADHDNFGNILTIRTGPGNQDGFSQWLVRPRRYRGGMPSGMAQHNGYLWRFESENAEVLFRGFSTDSKRQAAMLTRAERIPCPTERDFFAALGIPWIEPEQRDNYEEHLQCPT